MYRGSGDLLFAAAPVPFDRILARSVTGIIQVNMYIGVCLSHSLYHRQPLSVACRVSNMGAGSARDRPLDGNLSFCHFRTRGITRLSKHRKIATDAYERTVQPDPVGLDRLWLAYYGIRTFDLNFRAFNSLIELDRRLLAIFE